MKSTLFVLRYLYAWTIDTSWLAMRQRHCVVKQMTVRDRAMLERLTALVVAR